MRKVCPGKEVGKEVDGNVTKTGKLTASVRAGAAGASFP